MKEIIEAKPIMLGVDLDAPFELGFGTLESLPRVLYQVKALDGKNVVSGIGEASIDFPFSTYDAWDIYDALSKINLIGRSVNREDLLADNKIKESLLNSTPAANAAFNMAIDDLSGRTERKSVMDYYGKKRKGGKALASISYKDEISLLIEEINGKLSRSFIPKPKVGRGINEDVATISAVSELTLFKHIPFVLDFNAQYEPEDFKQLLVLLKRKNVSLSNLIFLEQPTTEESGIEGLVFVKEMSQELGYNLRVVADESFVTEQQAIECSAKGISLNFKIHKVGGIFEAREIEEKLGLSAHENMVGGTFPTAIGRTYDQQAGAVLRTTSLPGDGWEPSTDWFVGDKHLIEEDFERDSHLDLYLPFQGEGLGITLNWERIRKFVIDDPREEYRKIRTGQNGRVLKINIKDNVSYQDKYKERTGREYDWNL